MRVISGLAKGRRLKSIAGMETRPTSDRVKESLFSILGTRVSEACFLDLFAGNGGIGIEALSRGATEVVFVEKNHHVTKVIKENLSLTKLTGRVYTQDVLGCISQLGRDQQKFDIIFMDPPYGKGLAEQSVELVAKYDLLTGSGLLIIEHGTREEISDQIDVFTRIRKVVYGDTTISFYESRGEHFEN